jgi:hypothetical protein
MTAIFSASIFGYSNLYPKFQDQRQVKLTGELYAETVPTQTYARNVIYCNKDF